MPEVGLRVPMVPPDVGWSDWRAAGIDRLHLPRATAEDAFRAVAAAGIETVIDVDLDPATGAAELPEGTSLCLRLVGGGRPAAGAWWGASPVSGLDVLAAQLDCDAVFEEAAGDDLDGLRATLRRYLRARRAGYARAQLPADADAVALLLGDGADRLLAARARVVADSVHEAAARARVLGAERVLLEVDVAPIEKERLVAALVPGVDCVLIPVAPPLPRLLAAVVAASAAGAGGAVVQMPGDHLRSPEELADVLDLIDGAGCRTLLLSTNPGWLPIGAASVARAVARLHGRPGSLAHERQRRTELREA